jgi:hypothetical protein
VTGHPAPVSTRALWFGLLAAPLAWSVQLVAGYALSAQSCFPGGVPRAEPIAGGVGILVVLIGMMELVVGIGGLLVAVSSWRAGRRGPDDEVGSRVRFMALGGILMSAVFVAGIVMATISPFLIGPCGPA